MDLMERSLEKMGVGEIGSNSTGAEENDPFRRTARGLAHDINNMLTVIAGSLEGALDEVASERQDRRLRRALEALKRAEELTTKLSAEARGEQA